MYNQRYKIRQRRLNAVVQCLKEGMTNTQEIAEELGVSRRTVQRDIKYIRENQKG